VSLLVGLVDVVRAERAMSLSVVAPGAVIVLDVPERRRLPKHKSLIMFGLQKLSDIGLSGAMNR